MSACSASFLHIIFNTSYVNAKAKKKGTFPAVVSCQNSAKWSCVCAAASNLGSAVSMQDQLHFSDPLHGNTHGLETPSANPPCVTA